MHQNQPTCNTQLPLFNLQRYEANKICDILIGNSFAVEDYASKSGRPNHQCVKSEETAEHFFLACGLYQVNRPEDIDSLKLLDTEDCNTIVDYISKSTKLNEYV